MLVKDNRNIQENMVENPIGSEGKFVKFLEEKGL